MAEISYPHVEYSGGAVTEREYSRNIGWGTTSGLHAESAEPLFMNAGSLYLRANTTARLCGMGYDSGDTDVPVSIAVNGSDATRLDHVVLRLDWDTMRVRHAVMQGVPGGPRPTLRQQRGTGVFEVSLGQMAVPPGGTVANATLTRLAWWLGPDGTIFCTSNARPPTAVGRIIHEVDTDVWRTCPGVGEPWRELLSDTGDMGVALEQGWGNWLRVRRRNGLVTMHAYPVTRSGGTLPAYSTASITWLSSQFRPTAEVPIQVHILKGGVANNARVSVYPDGWVRLMDNQTPIEPGVAILWSASWVPGEAQ